MNYDLQCKLHSKIKTYASYDHRGLYGNNDLKLLSNESMILLRKFLKLMTLHMLLLMQFISTYLLSYLVQIFLKNKVLWKAIVTVSWKSILKSVIKTFTVLLCFYARLDSKEGSLWKHS